MMCIRDQSRGVNDTVIDELPMINVERCEKDVDHAPECAICQEDFSEGDQARQLPCKHFYHDECIRPWLKQSGTCPNW
jgi:E3 ubiquitin-protein ligase RNF115/126